MAAILFRPAAAALLFAAISGSTLAQTSAAPDAGIPAAPREFRGVWVATVSNIDWPSKSSLPVTQQQAELIRLLDRAREMKLNAVLLQVRPASDALYHSALEPWSEFLTGRQGQPPVPFYDPLQFAVEEAHKRGLELHAWFNPYRVSMPGMKTRAANNLSLTRPDLVRQYGTHQWLDPGEKGTQDHVLNVILDVVRRYDIDGVHFDDYFYPYKSYNKGADFPDDASWQKYKAAGGTLSRSDWRRENVNILVRNVNQAVHALKPHIRFGIAPFGIWQPGHPPGVVGLNSHEELYNDSRKWVQEGWVDYIAPQLYWKVTAPRQPYPALVKWWVEQSSRQGRHVWPGLIPSRVTGKSDGWKASEIVDQIVATRRQPGATGHILFSFKPLMRDVGGIATALTGQVYRGRALVPASPWLDNQPPSAPAAAAVAADNPGEMVVRWQGTGSEPAWLWGIYARIGNSWVFEVLPAGQTSMKFPRTGAGAPSVVAVSAVDRVGNESPRTIAFSVAPRTP